MPADPGRSELTPPPALLSVHGGGWKCYTVALLALFTISLIIRVYPTVALRFDGLYGQDPYAYYSYGQQVRDSASRLQLPGKFYWPLGYPALVALGFILTNDQPLGPQMVTLMAGAAVSVLTFLLTFELARSSSRSQPFARIAGLIAWAVVAVCGQLIQSSMVIMADAPALMWSTLSAWALVRYGRTRRARWIVLTAFALAWATMTRWQYGGLAPVWALYVITQRPIHWRHIVLAVMVGLITLSPQIAHSIQNPDPLLSHQWVQGWSFANAFARDFVTVDGTFHYDQTPAVYYAQPLYNVYFMSPLLIPLVVLGMMALFTSPPDRGILLVGWIAMQYGFLAGIPYQNIRFALAVFPPLAVLAGIGAVWLLSRRIRYQHFVQLVVVLVISYGLLTTLHAAIPMITSFVAIKDADLAAARWIEAHIPEPESTVYCLDLLLTMEHYTTLRPVQIFGLSPEVLNDQLAHRPRPAYAVFNLWTTEHQWVGKSPWIVYHWLLDHPGLTAIGTFGNYTLFRINP
ncbi:MAG: glycosyltransferase family 39 protein [Anaerolineae bacterium]|nr:glycosyltransferase family 39 protein [Anaerolineae bacterium]